MKTYIIILIAILLVSFSIAPYPIATADDDCDWTMFGGDPQRTRIQNNNCFSGNNLRSFELIWEYQSDQHHKVYSYRSVSGYPSPIVIGDDLILGIYEKLVCLDKKNGEKKWSFKTTDVIASTPTYHDERIIFSCMDGYLYILDARNGDEILSYDAGQDIHASPLIIDDKIIIQDRDSITCIDLKTADVIWKNEDGGYSTPAYSEETKKIFTGLDRYNKENFICLDPNSGNEIWSFKTRDEVQSSPSIVDNKVIFGCNDGYIYCLKQDNGELEWKYRTGDEITSSPCIYNNKAYIGTRDKFFICIDINNGKKLWEFKADTTDFSSATICNELLCFGGKNDTIYVVDSNDGKEIWSNNPKFNCRFGSQPVINNGNIFAATNSRVYCFGVPENSPKISKNIKLKLVVGNKNAEINNETVTLDVPPQIINGRTLIPVRFISEAFGCEVGWDGSTGKITISRGDFEVILFKDKATAYVNGKEIVLDVPATIIDGRTLVPVRFISESFGAEVSWDGNTKTITIDWEPF